MSLHPLLTRTTTALVIAAGCGNSGGAVRVVAGEKLVPVEQVTARPDGMELECRETARAVGYLVPCPRLLPQYATATGLYHSPCGTRYLAWFVHPACGGRRMVFASIDWETTRRIGHLVRTAMPRRSDARSAITYPQHPSRFDRIATVGRTTVVGHPAEIVECRSLVSDLLYSGHTVLVWSIGQHTYVLGFHGTDPGPRRLDEAVADSLRLISP